MGSMSIVHWLIVLAVVVLLFGPRRLPDLARGMGEAIREFKKSVKEQDSSVRQIAETTNSASSNSLDQQTRGMVGQTQELHQVNKV